jgi:hypothetical protein
VKKLQRSNSVLGFMAGILLLVLMGSYQAQAAWTKSEKSKIKTLEAKVQELETKLATYKTSSNSVLIPEAYSDLLGSECGRAGRYEREFAISGKRFFQCRFDFVVEGR